MKRSVVIAVCVLLFLPALISGDDQSAVELVKRMDSIIRGTNSSEGSMTMIIKKKRWRKPRTIKMKFWEVKRAENEPGKSFILITDPVSEAGKGFLKIGNEMWSYFPNVNTTTKIPPSMMLQNWMGSDFTNDDLVRESSIVLDYTHRTLDTETQNGVKLTTIELIPKPDAPVTWGKIVITVREEDAIPTRQEYYNEKGKLVRVMTFEDIKVMSGQKLPTKWTMIPKDKPGDGTVIIVNDMKFDAGIDPQTFTMANLRKGGL